jgi:pimeloyl-ACP methyl ester carboxylesterase
MPYLTVAGERLFYALSEGDVTGRHNLVLVHGAAGSHVHWPAELRRLPGVNVYALDLPAHGRSSGRSRAALQEYADTVHLFVLARGLRQATVLGHSMGGAIVQLLAARRPPWLERVVVAGAGARLRVDPAILEGLRPESGHDGFENAVNLICQKAYGPLASAQTVRHGRQLLLAVERAVFHADYLACAGFDSSGDLPHINLPVLVVSGGLDRMVPPEECRDLSRHVPGAQLVEIRDAGHMMIVERPMETTQAVSHFLRLT